MDTITKNTLVVLHILLKNEDGEIIADREELTYLHGGHNQIFPKLEKLLEGKTAGDVFELKLAPVEAFGEMDESLVVKELLEDLPEDISIGSELDGEDGVIYVVESIEEDYAVLNANHELAGISLIVSGEVLEIEQLTDKAIEEILNEEKH
ncbi:MAG: peptidylprolyl isomerase [Epsilonproteobacteria bacterium]|nr:peptidylprolyl isomerase [Campylobacterota bacterium]